MMNDVEAPPDCTMREVLTLVFAHALVATGKYQHQQATRACIEVAKDFADAYLKEPK